MYQAESAFHKMKSLPLIFYFPSVDMYAKGRKFSYGNTIKYDYTMVQVKRLWG